MILESEHPLITPDFIGTDEEKIAVLTYWSDIIGLVRSINLHVVSHENKLSIISQLKKEVELIDLEVNNATSHPTMNDDGSTEMTQDVPGEVIDLSREEETPSGGPAPTSPPNQSSSLFSPPKISQSDQMRKLAGIYPMKKK